MDQPNERKIHKNPIPRMGGAAIYISFIISIITSIYLLNEQFYKTDPTFTVTKHALKRKTKELLP